MARRPTARELIDEKFLRSPKSARGVYLDRRVGHGDVHMRFVWESPSKWVWMHEAAPLSGALTDGTINVIVKDGVAVLVSEEGEVGTTPRLLNMFRPSNYDFDGWELGPVTEVTVVGRSAWSFTCTPSAPGKRPHEVVFDADSGVILCMKGEGSYLGFEELELDEDIPEETFRWSGPVEPCKVGGALVIPEDDGTFSVGWQVSVRGRFMFHQQGLGGVSRDEAIAWGEARAAKTYVRGE